MSRQQRDALGAELRRHPKDSEPKPLAAKREEFVAIMGRMPVPGGVRTSALRLGGRTAVLVEPEGTALPGTLLYFHGGSFIMGSPKTAMSLTANLVVRSGIRAVSIDYRFAPEHPFPAAIEDCLAAYRELLDQGHAPSSIAFAGDSAGGGLTVTTCLAARDAGVPQPAAIVAFSPALDHTFSGASMASREHADPMFTHAGLREEGQLYLGGQDPHQPLLSPAVLADLRDLPPLLLQVGTNEVLLDDATRLAARARDAGVDVILDVTANVPHVFQAFTGQIDEAGEALDRAACFLKQKLAQAA